MTLLDYRNAMYQFRDTQIAKLHIRVQHYKTKKDLFSGTMEEFYDDELLATKCFLICEIRRVVCTEKDEALPIYNRSLLVTVY